jgi:hypothetical protein
MNPRSLRSYRVVVLTIFQVLARRALVAKWMGCLSGASVIRLEPTSKPENIPNKYEEFDEKR